MAGANDRDAGSLARPSGAAAPADPLSSALRALRLTSAQFFVVDASSPWCVSVPHTRDYAEIILPEKQHVISYHVMVSGAGYVSVPGVDPMRFEAGDIAVFPHGDAYLMESAPGAPPELDHAETLDFFRALAGGALPFVIPEGGGEDPPARFICGFLGCDVGPFNPLFASLPRLLLVRRRDGDEADLLDRLIAMTLEEAQKAEPGGLGVRLGLSELMFVELLRRHSRALGAQATGWLAGLHDAAVARTLGLMHARPEAPWSVAELAREAGVSRSVLAERFAALIGRSPIQYLTDWRMQLAARMLSEGGLAVAEIGRRVGYASEAAFSRGFKKCAGVSPDAWRRGQRAP